MSRVRLLKKKKTEQLLEKQRCWMVITEQVLPLMARGLEHVQILITLGRLIGCDIYPVEIPEAGGLGRVH